MNPPSMRANLTKQHPTSAIDSFVEVDYEVSADLKPSDNSPSFFDSSKWLLPHLHSLLLYPLALFNKSCPYKWSISLFFSQLNFFNLPPISHSHWVKPLHIYQLLPCICSHYRISQPATILFIRVGSLIDVILYKLGILIPPLGFLISDKANY